MGKVIFEYDTREEKNELLLHCAASDLYRALNDIDNKCRSAIKHDNDITDYMEIFLQEIRDLITESGARLLE